MSSNAVIRSDMKYLGLTEDMHRIKICGDLGLGLLTIGNVFSREGRRGVLAIGRTCISLCVVVAVWLFLLNRLGIIGCIHRLFVSYQLLDCSLLRVQVHAHHR